MANKSVFRIQASDPIVGTVRFGRTQVVITIGEVFEVLDHGARFGRSHKVMFSPDANAVEVHCIT